MSKQYFVELLRKYNEGRTTEEEHRFLLSYYELFESEPDVLAVLNNTQRERLRSEIDASIWSRIREAEDEALARSSRRLLIKRLSVAAMLLTVLTIGFIFYNKSAKPDRQHIAKAGVRKEHRLVRLPDGSTVIISAGSRLNYPSSFDGFENREVYLDGQAYFDIKHNKSKPFIIHTGKVATTVLGTAFNVKAWSKDASVVVTVTRGKVRIDDETGTLGIITPNQQIIYDKARADVVQTRVEAEKFLSWKEEDLLLENVTLAETAELLEDRFKVRIVLNDDEIRTARFTTTFLKHESLEDVLKSICEFTGTIYTYQHSEKQVVIAYQN